MKGQNAPRVEKITITLLVMGANSGSKTFYNVAAARAYFKKNHQSVCCYPLVTVDGKDLASIAAARRYFGIKPAQGTPWA